MHENSNFSTAFSNISTPIGPTDDELSGLNIEERKRRRSGPVEEHVMDTDRDTRVIFSEAAISNMDCAESSPNFLAKLAKQASQSQ